MRIPAVLPFGDAATVPSFHKALQKHGHRSRAGTHRFERRKVREYLRHAVAQASGVIDFAYPATGGAVPTATLIGADRSTGGSLKQNRKLRDCEITVRDGD